MTTDDILRAYIAHAHPLLTRVLKPNECIAATRASIEALRMFKIKAEPHPVRLVVTCQEKGFLYCTGLSDEERERAKKESKSFVERKPVGEGWHGHLVMIVEDHWLVDPTFHQASVPEYSFVLTSEPLVIDTSGYIDSAREAAIDAHCGLEDGTAFLVQYQPLDDHGFRQAPAWETDHIDTLITLMACSIAKHLRLAAMAR